MLAEKITAAGFILETDGRCLIVKPSGKLTDQQRKFIRRHRDQIIAELQAANESADRLAFRYCHRCGDDTLHQRIEGRWRCTRRHPASLADALRQACRGLTVTPEVVQAQMSPEDLAAWHAGQISLAELAAFVRAVDARLHGRPQTEPVEADDPLLVPCRTPAGGIVMIKARDEEHAGWLRKMNPEPGRSPRPDWTGRSSSR